MKTCPNCHAQTDDTVVSCPVCGTMLDAIGRMDPDFYPRETPSLMQIPDATEEVRSLYDHTGDYQKDDITENKVLCMVIYLLDVIGIIIALLMAPVSEYVRFHIRQALKFTVLESLIFLASALFCWTYIIPILGIIAMIVLIACKFACFIDVCRGKAVISPIIRIFGFLN